MLRLRSLGLGPDRPSRISRVFIDETNSRLIKRDGTRIIGSDRSAARAFIAWAKRERLPNQAETVLNPMDSAESLLARMPVAEQATKSYSDIDYLAASCGVLP